MNRFTPGNRVALLRSGGEYFPALVGAIEHAEREVWLETYIYADDESGRNVTEALMRAAQRGVQVRVLVDGWGAKHYLTAAIEADLTRAGVELLIYRPEVAPWQFRSHRLRRLHRKLCHVDGRVAFVGGINIIDDMNTPGQKPPRVDFAVRVEGPVLAPIVRTMQRVWAVNELVQFRRSELPLFPSPRRGRPRRRADREVRDPRQPAPPARHRDRLPGGDPHREDRDRHRQLVLLSRHPLPPRADRRGAAAASP